MHACMHMQVVLTIQRLEVAVDGELRMLQKTVELLRLPTLPLPRGV